MSESDNTVRKPQGMSWKYRARLVGVPLCARILAAMGISWPTIGNLIGRETMLAQAEAFAGIAPKRDPEHPLNVVFFTMMGGHTFLSAVEILLATALRARGHTVTMVLCDQQLPLCEIKNSQNEPNWEQACAKCYGYGKTAFHAAGLDTVMLSDLVARSSDPHVDEPWDQHVDAALLKHYRIGRLRGSDEEASRRVAFRSAALISARAARAVAAIPADRVVMSHGIYATWGPALDVLNAADIPVLVYSDTMKRGALRLHWRHDSSWHDIADEFERFRDVPLTDEEGAQLDSYLASRRTHSSDTRQYNLSSEEPVAELRHSLGLSPSKETFVLFTNLIWDAASIQREIVFSNPLEWAISTIDWFAAHPEVQLIVRPHPAEHVLGTNESVSASLLQARPSLPANVVVLQPDAPVNSWSLIELADCGIVHTSTVGLELSIEGKACILVSDTHYRGRGFTLDASDKEEYFDLLAYWRERRQPAETTVPLARRYASIFFERYQLPFPFLAMNRPLSPVAFTNVEDGWLTDDTIRMICDSLEDRTSPLLPPNAEPQRR